MSYWICVTQKKLIAWIITISYMTENDHTLFTLNQWKKNKDEQIEPLSSKYGKWEQDNFVWGRIGTYPAVHRTYIWQHSGITPVGILREPMVLREHIAILPHVRNF